MIHSLKCHFSLEGESSNWARITSNEGSKSMGLVGEKLLVMVSVKHNYL